MKMIKKITVAVFLAVVCTLSLLPFILMLLAAFHNSVDILRGDVFSHLSIKSFADNFTALLQDRDFVRSFLNSLVVSFSAVVLGLLLSTLGGYAYTMREVKQRKSRLFFVTFFSMLIPSCVTIIPLFMLLQIFHLLDSIPTLIFTSLNLPFYIYFFRQNSKRFSREILDAARVDGLNEFGVFVKIFLPNIKSPCITAALIMFINTWNSFLEPLVIVQSQKNMVLPLYLNKIGSNTSSDYGMFYMGLIISIIPVITLFIIFQKSFNMGMASERN